MDRSLYIAMSGAKQTLLAQTANANNLANAQTTGFKSDWEQFRSMPVFGPGFPTRVYAMTERP
ncbi:MAG: flagellar biosynthesis protein FlgF, partial [Methylovulum sp.]